MALLSYHQPTGPGDDQAAATNFLSRKKPKRPPMPSSSDFQSHHSTTAATVCNLSASQTARITQEFGNSLIAWIVGKDIRPRQLADRLCRHLRLTGDVNVIELGLGYFVLQFSETDYSSVKDLSWSIPNLCIYAFKWTPDFKPSEAINSSVDVWVRLPELPIEYYDYEILQRIAEAIGGNLVQLDPVTKDRTKCKFARICIRLNLCDPLPSVIKVGEVLLEIEYEGFDLLCPKCRRVGDLKHDCLSLGNRNPSGSSRFDPHRDRPPHHHHKTCPFKETGSSSKKPLIPPESSSVSASGSRFQVLGNDPMIGLKLNEGPSLSIGECEKRGRSRRINSSDVPVKDKAVAKQKGKCEVSVTVSVPPFLNLPKESTTTTLKAPELKHVATSAVKDQFKASKTSYPTVIVDHNNQPRPQPSLPMARIPSRQPYPASEASLEFHSLTIQRLTTMKKMTNTPSKEIIVDGFPTVYMVDPKKTRSLKITLLEVQTNSISNQNQCAMEFVPTARGGDEGGVGLEPVSGSETCSKKILCWKFHGTDNAQLMRALKDLIQLHEPSIVLIFGTKISGADADQVVQELAFSSSYSRKPDGYKGGVCLLLSRQDVHTEVNSYSPQQVSASVYFHSETNVPESSPWDVDTKTSTGLWGSTFFYTATKWMSPVA